MAIKNLNLINIHGRKCNVSISRFNMNEEKYTKGKQYYDNVTASLKERITGI